MFDTTNFPNAKKIWFMGEFQDWSDCKVHCMSHALHYGTSVFEGIRAYATPKGPAVFKLEEHIDRFLHSADVIKMRVPYSKAEIIQACLTTVRENELESAYIRPLLYYSFGNLGLVPKACPVELLIGAWEWGAYLGEKAVNGVDVYIVPWRRVHHSQYDMAAKLGGIYVQSMFCGVIAREKGYDEAVFLNLEGEIAEGPGENILIVKDGVLKTNDMTESVLAGITRTTVLEIAQDLGIPTAIAPIHKKDMFQADEVMFSGTAVEVVPIIKVTDGSRTDAPDKDYTIGTGSPGPITMKLREVYMETVAGNRPEYDGWLSYVNS
jgi:branched-chain amino acid aminotransferase